MARRSSGGRSGGGFSRAPKASKSSKSTTPASVPAKSSAPVKSEPVTGGLGAAVADGLSWGVGTAIAHRVADAVMGPRVFRHEASVNSGAQAAPNNSATHEYDACVGQYKAFEECLNTSGNDISRCQFYMDMLTECRKAAPPTTHPPTSFAVN